MFFELAPHANIAALKEFIKKIGEVVWKLKIPRLNKTTVYVRGFDSKFETKRMVVVFVQQNKTLAVKGRGGKVFHRERRRRAVFF